MTTTRKDLFWRMINRGEAYPAGRCMARRTWGGLFTSYHPDAPLGVSVCPVCGRSVWRGMGRWWQ